MNLDLIEEELSLLYRVVNNRLSDLREEVRHTKDSESVEYLKHKERILNHILNKFPRGFDEHAHTRGYIK
jgi:hypothetical protein